MSKELIDRLKSYIPSGDGHHSQYANDLADAVAILEAKAATVGEREAFEVAYAEIRGCLTADVVRQLRRGDDYAETKNERLNIAWRAYQAGAAHQRQQAREVVISELSSDADSFGPSLNEAGWVFIETCPEKGSLLFNSCKTALRPAILKYLELEFARLNKQEAK